MYVLHDVDTDQQYSHLHAVRASQAARTPGASNAGDLVSCGRQGPPFLGGLDPVKKLHQGDDEDIYAYRDLPGVR